VGSEHRKALRRQIRHPALMLRPDGSVVGPCTVLDVSAGGARLKMVSASEAPSDVTLVLSRFNTPIQRRCAVVWRTEEQVGVRFVRD
jgi:hypothetical protein